MIRHLKCKIFGFNVHQSSQNLLKETWGTTQWTHLLHDWFWHVIGSRFEVLNGNKKWRIQQRMFEKEKIWCFLQDKTLSSLIWDFLQLIEKQQCWMEINILEESWLLYRKMVQKQLDCSFYEIIQIPRESLYKAKLCYISRVQLIAL